MNLQANETTATDITALVLKFLDMATTDINQWLDLLHEDCVLEFPYSESANLPQRFSGKETIRNSTEFFLSTVPGIRFNYAEVFPCIDPHLAFAKYEVNVFVPATGRIYKQSYITMFTEAGGKIIRMAEYYDPAKYNNAFK